MQKLATEQPSLTTVVYKYKPYAPWMIVMYCLMVLGFFVISAVVNSTGVVIYCAVLFGLPVYAAIFPKSIFSVRAWGDRKIIIGSSFLQLKFSKSYFAYPSALANIKSDFQ